MRHAFAGVVLSLLLAPAALGAEGAHLGVILGAVDDAAMRKLDYNGRGAYVMEVVADSPADHAGMKDRDIIVGVDGDVIIGPGHLRDVLALHRPGDNVVVTVWRKGAQETLHVALGEPESRTFLSLDPNDVAKTIVLRGEPRAWLGVKTQELTEQLGERFGSQAGVLVSEVIDGSPAAKAGLLAGDVILRIGQDTVGQPFELTKLLGDQQPGDKVSVVLMRDGRELTREVELGETPEKYRKALPQILSWTEEGKEPGLRVLPELSRLLPSAGLDVDGQERHRDLQQELKELRETLTEQMKALRSELEELKKELKRTE